MSIKQASLALAIIADVTVSGLPPGVNNYYTVSRGRKILSAKGRAYQNDMVVQLRGEREQLAGLSFEAVMLELFAVCFFPPTERVINRQGTMFQRKSSALVSSDSDGRIKSLKDAFMTGLGVVVVSKGGVSQPNDSIIYGDHIYKWAADPARLEMYPVGYTRVILAYFGHSPEILAGLRKAVLV